MVQGWVLLPAYFSCSLVETIVFPTIRYLPLKHFLLGALGLVCERLIELIGGGLDGIAYLVVHVDGNIDILSMQHRLNKSYESVLS